MGSKIALHRLFICPSNKIVQYCSDDKMKSGHLRYLTNCPVQSFIEISCNATVLGQEAVVQI